MILVTGGAGFIGSNFVLDWIAAEGTPVVNLDKLTYAGNPENLASLKGDSRYVFAQGDICDRTLVASLLQKHQPQAIVHFAAESHVDRSIHGPGEFVQTNVVGTFSLLEEARAYWGTLAEPAKSRFRFLHVSTDEVYGSLGMDDSAFSETNRCRCTATAKTCATGSTSAIIAQGSAPRWPRENPAKPTTLAATAKKPTLKWCMPCARSLTNCILPARRTPS